MKKSIIIFIILACFTIAQQPLVLPGFFYGDAEVNDRDAPVQSIIVAEIDGNFAGETKITDSGRYGKADTHHKFAVSGSYSDMGKDIEFYLNLPGFEPIKAEQTGTYLPGGEELLDLTFTGEEIPLPEEPDDDTDTDKPKKPRKPGAPASYGAPVTSGGASTKALFYFEKIQANRQVDMNIEQDDIPFTKLQLILNNEKTEVRFRFELVGDVDIPKLENVYHYVEIDAPVIAGDDVNTAIIWFRVAKVWLMDYDASKVTLYRYNDGWEALNTVEAGSDARFYYYRAETPGFSYFAIVSEAKTEPETIVMEPEQPKIGENVPEETKSVSDNKDESDASPITGMFVKDNDGKTNPLGLVVVIMSIIIIAMVAYYFVTKR